MKRYPIVFSIGATDCIGVAGIQADIKVASALGVYVTSAISGIAIQDTSGDIVSTYPVPPYLVKEQIEIVMEELHPNVVKVGLVNNLDVVHTIADCLRKYHPRYVVFDPVIFTVYGKRILQDENVEVVKRELFPFTNLITMTLQEAEILTKIKASSVDEMRVSAENLAEISQMSVLLKGDNLEGGYTYMILRLPTGEEWMYKMKPINTLKLHGSGSTLSAAIASFIALEYSLAESVARSIEYLRSATLHGSGVRLGHSEHTVCHTFNPEKMNFIDPGF